MEQYFIRKYVFAGIFLVFLFGFSGWNFLYSAPKIGREPAPENIESLEKSINKNMVNRYEFIEGYGFLQTLLGKNEINNFEAIKDTNGSMYELTFRSEPYYAWQELASRVVRMQESIGAGGCKVAVLIPPAKDITRAEGGNNGFPTNYFNETADLYKEYLLVRGIPVIDFRETPKCSAIPESEKFYRTDHHWKVETAFAAFCDLVTEMEKGFGVKWDADGYYTNPEHYNKLTYKNCFLGSYGRKTGLIYGGLDDFTAIYPKFTTKYSYYYEVGRKSETLQGRFEEALFYSNYLETDNIYNSDKYMSYLESLRSLDQITNQLNQDGDRVLFIRDSYTAPLAAFLSTVLKQVDMIYPLGYENSIENYIEANNDNYDYIFISMYPENMTTEAYSFYEENGDEGK